MEKTRVFVQVPNYWAVSDSLQKAFQSLKQMSGRDVKQLKTGAHFALEFPAGAKITVSEIDGSWSADKAPVALLSSSKLAAKHEARLKELISK